MSAHDQPAADVQEPRVWLKENALRLADHHRAFCPGESCTVSLVALGELIRLAGFDLTDDDVRRLM